jgi:hypothetical protein
MQMPTPEVVLEPMVRAVEKVRARLRRATTALNVAGVPYAVIGDFAVAAWVASVDKSAVRNTPEVEFLTRRAELPSVRNALIAYDFVYREIDGRTLFLERPDASERDSVRIFFAGDSLRPEATVSFPDPAGDRITVVLREDFKVLNLGPLVTISLSSFRTLDRLRVRDLIDVGVVTRYWLELLPADPPELRERLRLLLDTPDG